MPYGSGIRWQDGYPYYYVPLPNRLKLSRHLVHYIHNFGYMVYAFLHHSSSLPGLPTTFITCHLMPACYSQIRLMARG